MKDNAPIQPISISMDKSVVKIRSGSYDVLATGSVFSFNGNPISFYIGKENNPLKLTMIFVSNEEDKKFDVSTTMKNNELVVTLTNCNNPIGIGTRSAIELGSTQGRKLYLQHRISGDDESKLLFYTFYLGAKVEI